MGGVGRRRAYLLLTVVSLVAAATLGFAAVSHWYYGSCPSGQMTIYTGHGDRQDPVCSIAPQAHLEIGTSYPVYAAIHCDIMWLDLDGRRFFRVPYSGFAGSGPGLGSVRLTSRDHAVFEGGHSYRVELSARPEDAQPVALCL